MGAYQDAMKRFGHTRAFALIFKRTLPQIDRAVSFVTRGKHSFGETVVPTFILIHSGRKSGNSYRTPLAYVRVDGGFAVAASNWGQPHHPAWSENLSANPDAQVIVDGETVNVRVRRVGAEENAELWKKLVEIWPAYETYLTRSKRDIRVFLLERR